MAKRIYFETVKLWFLKHYGKVAVSGTAIGTIFLYMSLMGMIDIISFSPDVMCAGIDWENDPCHGIMNIIANEDIFIYPIGYDPWGRNTPFDFDPNVKDWKLQRKWGDSWRDIDLTSVCTSPTCGMSTSTVTKYALALRKGKQYQLRLIVLKHNPTDSIKWSAFNGEIDPIFEPIDKDYIFTELKENNAEGKSKFEMNNPYQSAELKFNFIEMCGHVKSYKIMIDDICERTILENIYKESLVCNTTKNCSIVKTVVGHKDKIIEYPCKTEIDNFSYGITDYYLVGDITDELCDNGLVGHFIDWIPTLEVKDDDLKTILYTKNEWAIWEQYTEGINESDGHGTAQETNSGAGIGCLGVYINITSETNITLKKIITSSGTSTSTCYLYDGRVLGDKGLNCSTVVDTPMVTASVSSNICDIEAINESVILLAGHEYTLAIDHYSNMQYDAADALPQMGDTGDINWIQGFSTWAESGYARAIKNITYANLTLKSGNNPPTFNETIANFSFKHIENLNLIGYNFSDIDGDNVTLTVNIVSGQINNDTDKYNLTWNPTIADVGEHNITVNLTDTNGGKATQTFTLLINKTSINTSMYLLPINHSNLEISSTVEVLGKAVLFNATVGDNITAISSFNVKKLSGGGTDVLRVTFRIDDTVLGVDQESVVSLNSINSPRSTGKDIAIYTIPTTGEHNFTTWWSRTGLGNDYVYNIDMNLLLLKSTQNYSIFANTTRLDTTFTTTTESDIGNLSIPKALSSGTYYIIKQTVKGTAIANTISARMFNNEESTWSPISKRYLANSGDTDSMSIAFVESDEEGTHNHSMYLTQDKSSTTIYNASIFHTDLRDTDNNTINNFVVVNTEDKVLGAGVHNIVNGSLTLQDGNSIYGTLVLSYMVTSSNNLLINFTLNTSNGVCAAKERTTGAKNSDIANVYLFGNSFLCNPLVAGQTENISVFAHVPAGESITIFNDTMMMSAFEATKVEFGDLNVPPIIVDNCANPSDVFHNKNMSCQLNVTDPDGDTLVYAINDTRLTINNLTGLINDTTFLSEYGTRIDVSWNVTDSINFVNTSFIYTINDTAPTFNESIGNFLLTNIDILNVTYNVSDFEQDPITLSSTCDFLTIKIDNITNSFTAYYIPQDSEAGINSCNYTINDTKLGTTSNNFVINVSLAGFNATIGENFSIFIEDINLSKATINWTHNLYTEYNVLYENESLLNPVWNINNSGETDGAVEMKVNQTYADITVKCGCSYDVGSTINLTTSYQDLCILLIQNSSDIWCWVDYIQTNFTLGFDRDYDLNITFMGI